MSSSDTGPGRRSGGETRAAIQQTALAMFTARGYELTSMREIADDLGIRKASLYYHFAGKEEILRSLVEDRSQEAADLLEWIRRQPQTTDLVRKAVLRWVESFSADKLRGIRFQAANPLLLSTLDHRADDGAETRADNGADKRIGSALALLVDALAELLPVRTAVTVLQLRMALLSINAAVEASGRTTEHASGHASFSDTDLLAAARANAAGALDALLGPN